MTEFALTKDYLEASPDGIVVTGSEGLILLVNAQAKALFGHPRYAT